MLNGRSINITCNSATTTSRDILETVIKAENYIENYFLCLCAIIGGDFVFLPPDFKIYKVKHINFSMHYQWKSTHIHTL